MGRSSKILGLKALEDLSLQSTAWKDKASCSSKETTIFFSALKSPETYQALIICKQCPVRNHCLLESIQYDYQGIWGGSTYEQRSNIVKILLNNYVGSLTLDQCDKLIAIIDSIGTSKASAIADLINYKSEHIDMEYNV